MNKKIEKMIKERQVRIFSKDDHKHFELSNLSYYSYGYENDHELNAKDLLIEDPANSQ